MVMVTKARLPPSWKLLLPVGGLNLRGDHEFWSPLARASPPRFALAWTVAVKPATHILRSIAPG